MVWFAAEILLTVTGVEFSLYTRFQFFAPVRCTLSLTSRPPHIVVSATDVIVAVGSFIVSIETIGEVLIQQSAGPDFMIRLYQVCFVRFDDGV